MGVASNFDKRLSNQALNYIKQLEGLRLQPYDDQTSQAVDHWVEGATIGYGYLITRGNWNEFKDGITEQRAHDMLVSRLSSEFEPAVRGAINADITQDQYDALVLLCYNIGPEKFRNSNVTRIVNGANGDLDRAWLEWRLSQGRPMDGLSRRRRAELQIYHNGAYTPW